MSVANQHIQNILKHLTSEPGVYRMFDKNQEIIYVGKAVNLKKRVSSYFVSNHSSSKTRALVAQISNIEITVTRSDKEALLLECTLIKQLRPKFNILMRDDKSYPYLLIQQGHDFPKMSVVRFKNLPKEGIYFGPYINAGRVYATIKLLQSIFKIRNCTDQEFARRIRPCLQYQIKRCSAPCVKLITKADYNATIKQLLKFLQGKDQDVFKYYQQKMDSAAERLAYEEAAIWRDNIKKLRLVQEQQAMICVRGDLDVIVIDIIQDLAGIIRVSIRDGSVISSEVFFPKIPNIDWYESLQHLWQEIFSDFVSSFYTTHNNQIPATILTSRNIEDKEMLMAFLGNCKIEVPHRGQKKDWLDFAIKNLAVAVKTHNIAYATIKERYQSLSDFLAIKAINRMECFDISHMQGQQTVASCVVFDNFGPSKKDYRIYNIKDITPGDDYAAMRQVILRRVKFYLQNPLMVPQVVIIDGGKGQVAEALQVLKDFMAAGMQVLGVSKGPMRKAGMEKLILANQSVECSLPSDSAALHLLQHIRDEAHRFAIKSHRVKRAKKNLESTLESIDGIGAVRRKTLLESFGGIRELSKASIDEIAKVPGISYDLAAKVFGHFHKD